MIIFAALVRVLLDGGSLAFVQHSVGGTRFSSSENLHYVVLIVVRSDGCRAALLQS